MKNTKKCSKCNEIKKISDFGKRKENCDGRNGYCRDCSNKQAYTWRKNNLEKYKKTKRKNNKKYYNKNKEELLKKNKIRRENNKEKYKKIAILSQQKYKINNPEKYKEIQSKSHKKWRKKNPEKYKEMKRKSDKKYYKKNKIKIENYKNRYYKKKRQHDLHFKLKKNMSVAIYQRLKKRLSSKKGKSTFDFLPYTIDELKQHLEKQFEPWMNWNNWGVGEGKWQIDHIKPDSLFNYKSVDDKEFQECWSLNNLQPLDAIENIKKSNKY